MNKRTQRKRRLIVGALVMDGWMSARDISKATGIWPTRLYPLLQQLEDDEIIEGYWKPWSSNPSQPRTRLYRLDALYV